MPPRTIDPASESRRSQGPIRASRKLGQHRDVSTPGRVRPLSNIIQVGGLLASIGSRLLEATARKLMDRFFDRLSAEVA